MLTPPIKPIPRNGKTNIPGNSSGQKAPPSGAVTSLFGQTPTFPASVYDGLPIILKEGCNAFSDQREKDLFLLSAIVVLSGCMPTVLGIYDGAEVKANLYAFIVAPAGSGKGVLSCARMLGVGLHKHRKEESERLKTEYELRVAEARADKQVFLDLPPPYKCLFIPGNSSSAAIVKSIKDNDNNGVICETEADSLSGALKQDWGDFSDVLRKAFHHEVVSSSRKQERHEVEYPALSVILAGTPGQVRNLISDAENGLFSRFLFYRYEKDPFWRDVSPVSGRPSLNKYFGSLAERVKDMALLLESLDLIEFSLTDSQWRVLNLFCKDWLECSVDDTDNAISSTVFRLGLKIYRVSIVLSVVRCYEQRVIPAEFIVCDDLSFTAAIDLAKVLLDHSKLMFDTMPKPRDSSAKKSGRQKYLESLPHQFTRQEADAIGKSLSVTERTVTNYLERLTAIGQLLKIAHGQYQKP